MCTRAAEAQRRWKSNEAERRLQAKDQSREKSKPARLVSRELSLDDVSDTLERMTRFDTVGFNVITKFA